MSSQDELTQKDERAITSAYAGALINKKPGVIYNRGTVNQLFKSATGKNLGQSHMRNSSVIKLLTLEDSPQKIAQVRQAAKRKALQSATKEKDRRP